MQALARMFGTGGFMPHGHCYLWQPALLWLHAASDGLIFLAYISIPITLAWFVRRRPDLPFQWTFVTFGLFILACGLTHAMEVWTLWVPLYWLSGTVKAVTAAVSIVTAILLVRLAPHAVRLPSHASMQREMSERSRAEQRFRGLMEGAPDALVITGPDGRIAMVNRQAEILFGYTREEMLGQLVEMLVPPRLRGIHPVHRATYMRQPGVRPMGIGMELSAVRKDGVEVPVEISLSPLASPEGILVTAVIRDVSERRITQDKLRQYATALELSNRELEEFAYVASHDLQEPLRKISAFGDRLREAYGDRLEDRGLDYLDRMQGAARRMGDLIQGLLQLSHITTRAHDVQPIDLRGVIAGALADLEERIRSAGGVIEVGDLPAVAGDPVQMRELFQNLIGNALKYHRPGVAPRVVLSGAAGPHGTWEIRVADNGIGFEPRYAEQIFQPFQRLVTRAEFEGSGMGLAICRRIVERHGGTLTAEGRPGEGSVFTLRLPRDRAAAGAAA